MILVFKKHIKIASHDEIQVQKQGKSLDRQIPSKQYQLPPRCSFEAFRPIKLRQRETIHTIENTIGIIGKADKTPWRGQVLLNGSVKTIDIFWSIAIPPFQRDNIFHKIWLAYILRASIQVTIPC